MTDRRLIEEELPLKIVNEQSAREKSLRHGHISTMHLWWARRPLAMSRAVVYGTLLPDPGDAAERKAILDELADAASFENSTKPTKIGPLRRRLAAAYPDGPPKVLDCFAGGGAIPLEALRLGCDTTAVDLNPVAHLIEKCVLEFPQRFPDLADDFVKWAGWVRNRAEPKLEAVFPADANGRRPAVYFWARTMMCPNPSCRAEIPLLSSRWLANTERRSFWVDVTGRSGHISLTVREGSPSTGIDCSVGTVKASSVTCPACSTSTDAKDVRSYAKSKGFGELLYAVLDIDGKSRLYRTPTLAESEGGLKERIEEMINSLSPYEDDMSPLPDEPVDSIGYINLQNLVFGYNDWVSLFGRRQALVLATLCEAVRSAHREMISSGMDPERAKAVATFVALCVDRIADYNSAFATWAPTGEFVRSTFPRQAIAMAWDHTEINPFQQVSGSWDGAVRWVELAIRHCSASSDQAAHVTRGNTQELGLPTAEFDAVIIDPPYYFSVMYSDLSDFFYVWLKRSIGHLYPNDFLTQWTPKDQEVIQNRTNPKDPRYISADQFEERLKRSLRTIARVVKPDTGVVSIVFAHTDVVAWERLLRSLQSVGLVVSTSWPMRSERAGRQLAQVKAALGSSVVLVCRRSTVVSEGFYDDVVRALEQRIAERLDAFESMGLVGADYFVSAIGPAFEVFAQYSRITKLSGEEVDVSDLMILARQTVAQHAMRRLLGSDTLADLDAESLFYLTWRWAYLIASVPADEAYKLERAFDVDLGHLTRPGGLAAQSGASFVLLGPQDRKGIKLSASPSLVDVLHLACQLWEAGRRKELEELLGATGMGVEPGFWAMARTLGELLPDGNRERTMLLGLTGNRDVLSEAAAKSSVTIEAMTLFGSEVR